MKKLLLVGALIGAQSLIMNPAVAGVFSVTPVRIFMTTKDRGVAVTLNNEGDTEVALQADISVWTQKPDGTDELVPSDDMILSPPILKLAPNSRQVVRLAMLKPADASRQLTYRMIVREVPEAIQNKDPSMEVPISLALSLPVFITPPPAKRDINCTLKTMEDKTLAAVCSNTGTAYAQMREIVLQRGDQKLAHFEGGSYILPGATKNITLTAEKPVPAGKVDMNVAYDDGGKQQFQAELP